MMPAFIAQMSDTVHKIVPRRIVILAGSNGWCGRCRAKSQYYRGL